MLFLHLPSPTLLGRPCRGDLELWSRWLRFCAASRSWRQMSRVLTRALQLHSGTASLWAYAAAWEFEHNANAAAARALMQRGLRMCRGRDAEGLWHEYFKLELLYALRLRQRRRVLGIDDDAAATGGQQGRFASWIWAFGYFQSCLVVWLLVGWSPGVGSAF
jgi:U3 small nucleolar RNA-associated protein 6